MGLKRLVHSLANKAGYQISRVDPQIGYKGYLSPFSQIEMRCGPIVDLEAISKIGATIPGMITTHSGRFLYSLCYLQSEEGDVVEVGSWQGRSTSFLARATSHSNNGQYYAVDHFRGNVGKEHYYVVEKDDLSDLKRGFLENVERIGLSASVNLLDMTNVEAAKILKEKQIRFLFIDGDHTKDGVQRDIDLFFPMLVNGAIIVFDDFSKGFPGLIEALDNLLMQNRHSRVMSYANTLVLKHTV